jgi:acyl-CoA oxidase
MASSLDRLAFRTKILTDHLLPTSQTAPALLPSPCLNYTPPDLSDPSQFDTRHMRALLDGHNLADRDWLFGLMTQSKLFCPRERGVGRVFVGPDYNQSMEQQREMTMRRIEYLSE